MGSIWQSTGLFIFEEVSLSLKVGGQTLTFLLKVPPKMKASKMCRVRVFFWVRNGHHHHFRNVMTSFYGYEVFPFFSHLRSIWSSLLIEAFACKRKKWSTFPSCHLFKAPFSAFFRRKKGGEFVFMNPKILFSFSPTEMKVFRFFFSIMNQHVILFTRNVVQYSLKSISQENICYGPRSMTLRPTECDSFFYFNQLRDFVAPLQ